MGLALRHNPPRKLVVSRDQAEALKAFATAALPNETGGILLGWRTAESIHVFKVLEVPDHGASRTSYLRGHSSAEAALRTELVRLTDSPAVGYVGEWHSHPVTLPASPQDGRELKEIARLAGGAIAMLVVVRAAGAGWDLQCHNALGRKIERAIVNVERGDDEQAV